MNKIQTMLVMIMSAATVAMADPQATSTPPATPPSPTPPPSPAQHASPGQPTAGPRAGAPANPMMRRFMGGGSEGMIMWMLSGDPRTAQELGLSDAQVKEIKEAMASADKEMAELNGKLEQAAKQQSEFWKADTFDEDGLMKAAGETGDISSQIAKMRVKQAITAFKVLTPEQRVKFRETMKQRMGQLPQQQWMPPNGAHSPQPGGAMHGHSMAPVAPLAPQPATATTPATPAPAPATPPAPAPSTSATQ